MPNNNPSDEPTVMDQDFDWSQVSDPYAEGIIRMITEFYPIPPQFQERISWAFYSLAKQVATSVNTAQTLRAIQDSRKQIGSVFHAILERSEQSSGEEEEK